MQSGGRIGYPTTPAFGGDPGFRRGSGGRPQYGQGYPNRAGRPQPRSFGGQRSGFGGSSVPTTRPNYQYYWQEETGQYDDRYYQGDQEQVEEQYVEEEAGQEHFGEEDAESDSEYQDAYEYLQQRWG
jgi:nitrogen fixation-related uncharacterized protein